MNTFVACTLAAVAVVAAFTTPNYAKPSAKLTPGVVATTDTALICSKGYSLRARDVKESTKKSVYAEYGILSRVGYVVDHKVSIEVGGSNSLPNLWPQPASEGKIKDRLENKLHALVCAGKLNIKIAQRDEARDWVVAYKKYVGAL